MDINVHSQHGSEQPVDWQEAGHQPAQYPQAVTLAQVVLFIDDVPTPIDQIVGPCGSHSGYDEQVDYTRHAGGMWTARPVGQLWLVEARDTTRGWGLMGYFRRGKWQQQPGGPIELHVWERIA